MNGPMVMSGNEGPDERDTVLIIEDEPALLDIYTTKLQSVGYRIVSAADGAEGLNRAVSDPPSVILLDVVLPVKDGFDVLRDLKMNPKTADIPVIILSNLGQDYEIKRGLELGAVAFLTKANLLPSQIVKEVEKALSRARP